MAEHGEGLERYFEALNIDHEETKVQRTVTSQVELIFNRLDDLEVDSPLTVLKRKVDVFAEELDDDRGEGRPFHQESIAMQLRGKKMPEPKLYDGTREARKVDNLFWHLEQYFEALDINNEKDKVQTVVLYLNDTAALWWRRRYTDGCDVKTWEKFERELKRQLYPKSVIDIAMINLQRLRQKGSICSYMKADFNIIDMDELGVVPEMDFMKKSSATLNPYCGVMMMVGKEGQPE
ncbi:hypothetical protein RJ639_038699 [Escallonia herrerae]|uniref:Retrotransposon gag domain-containing protein n=1 Tax=Escallonia herrerae TaxID=1293975 RepID=A0AA88WVS8_9ASTE|nr:hypothetical protein RJ639_038699 [Escallonia herrerae]